MTLNLNPNWMCVQIISDSCNFWWWLTRYCPTKFVIIGIIQYSVIHGWIQCKGLQRSGVFAVVQGKGSRKAWKPVKSRKINDTVKMSHSQSPPGYAKGSCCLKSVCANDLLSLHPACSYSLLHKALEMWVYFFTDSVNNNKAKMQNLAEKITEWLTSPQTVLQNALQLRVSAATEIKLRRQKKAGRL